jgi:hypothetical protein
VLLRGEIHLSVSSKQRELTFETDVSPSTSVFGAALGALTHIHAFFTWGREVPVPG